MNSHSIYRFTLVLKNADEKTTGLEDSIYQSGCDDALINYKNGTIYLEFIREAESYESAVFSAIESLRSIKLNADVV